MNQYCYIIKLWNDYKSAKVLVVAKDENEAVVKLKGIDFSFDNLKILGKENNYDFVIL